MSPNPYDEVRYSNFPYAQTHPDRLATVAILYGLEPPDPFNARVLEIGCGAGGNLMAMVAATPGIRAVGVDLAAAPVAEARAAAAEIGLDRVEFVQADVRTLTDGSLGAFDYIVAHGVYGWIPADAREALLKVIATSLTPSGVAYVSYNAQPGGYFRQMLRDVGLWHARGVDGEAERAEKARELYQFLKEHRTDNGDELAAVLAREIPPLADGPTYRLVHDDLSEHWQPLWFAEFAGHAAAYGLGYVGEADLYGLRNELLPGGLEAEVWKLAGGDRIAFENLSDLLTARHFRQSVLRRGTAPLPAQPDPACARRLHWAARPKGAPIGAGLVAAAFAELDRRRPQAVGFDELRAALDADSDALAEALLDGFRHDHLIPHAGPLWVATEPGERPVASALARWQAAKGGDLTSLAYLRVQIEEPAARLLITLLDGSRDRAAIRAELKQRAGLELSPDDLDANLVELARLCLLEPTH